MHLQMCSIQLNQYETALYFLQLSQNVMTDCLLISVFLPVLTCCEPKIVLIIYQYRTISGSHQVRTGTRYLKTQKSTNNQSSSFGLIDENMELSRIHYL